MEELPLQCNLKSFYYNQIHANILCIAYTSVYIILYYKM